MIIFILVIAIMPRSYFLREEFVEDIIGSVNTAREWNVKGSRYGQPDMDSPKPISVKPHGDPTANAEPPIVSKPLSATEKRRLVEQSKAASASSKISCDCDCDDLRFKLDTNCSHIQTELDMCNAKLLDASSACEVEKGQMQELNQYRVSAIERELQRREEEVINITQTLNECNMKFNMVSSKNSQLQSDNANLRRQLVDIQGMISKSGTDNGDCNRRFADLSRQYDNLSARFVQTVDEYRGATEGLRNLSDSYSQLKQKVDQCTK
jgi:predicted nuclease with TOPRIM domain